MNPPTRILIADDHGVAREGLRAMLTRRKDFQIVGEAHDGEEAVARYDELSPDVLMLDLRMPRRDGFAVLETLRDRRPPPRVIVLTTYEGDEDVRRALAAGARGYLLKDATRQQVWEAVDTVRAGGTVVTPAMMGKVAASFSRPDLSAREREVLVLLADGRSNKEIGAVLSISEVTAKSHVTSILKKLGAAGRTEAVVFAAKRGLVRLG